MGKQWNSPEIDRLAARVRRLELGLIRGVAQGTTSTGGGGGTTDHAQLSNLNYADAGHIDFMERRSGPLAQRGNAEDHPDSLYFSKEPGAGTQVHISLEKSDAVGGGWFWQTFIAAP